MIKNFSQLKAQHGLIKELRGIVGVDEARFEYFSFIKGHERWVAISTPQGRETKPRFKLALVNIHHQVDKLLCTHFLPSSAPIKWLVFDTETNLWSQIHFKVEETYTSRSYNPPLNTVKGALWSESFTERKLVNFTTTDLNNEFWELFNLL